MAAHASGYYVYFNNITYNPERYHIGFILNHRHDIYITSSFRIMEVTFISFPKTIC